jgi:E2/UBC family protein E
VIFRQYPLPVGHFDAARADILVILPPGYPDAPPDMFHLMPWVRIARRNAYPRAADQSVFFNGQNWQRWSRHNSEWRPGVDGIWSMLKRIDHALKGAA